MPRYCFTNNEGDTIARYYPITGDVPEKIKLGKKWFSRNFRAEHSGTKHIAGTYPFASTAAGVSPEQVPEIMKVDAQAGVKTEYTKGGDPIFTSANHRRKYLKVHGLVDRSSWC